MKSYDFEPFDIIVFPIIDWYYRFQRPQQLATQFALHGHRVFYLRTYFSRESKPICQPIRTDISITDVQLGLPADKNIAADQLDPISRKSLLEQVASLRKKYGVSKAFCFVDIPFWGPLALDLQTKYGWKVVYDCMDHFSGFYNVTSHMLESEGDLAKKSDLILATSQMLFDEKSRLNSNCLYVPNGTEFEHFNYSPENCPEELAGIKKPIVGYYGAISDWFDTDLVCNLATARPEWNFVFIGSTAGADVSSMKILDNVFLLGEKPYEFLPGYLQYFDICIIPFKRIPLTEATNPVKLFEYLSAGKSIVATELNELLRYREYARLVSSVDEWLAALGAALNDYHPTQVAKRLMFARQNTWEERSRLVEDALQYIAGDCASVPDAWPPAFPEEYQISSKLLTRHRGVDYWCRVYEKDAVVYKQTNIELARREARILSQFKINYFPKFLEVQVKDGYGIVACAKVNGQSLQDAALHIGASAAALHDFIQDCLNMLLLLKKNEITHRNINQGNLRVRNGRPILLDFEWAVSRQEPFFTPSGLGGQGRPPEGAFSDVYSMGLIFKYVNRQRYQEFDRVISLMMAKDPSMRIGDVNILKVLFNTALKNITED
ncbi:MAG: glycosyltransferase [Chloroflexi bacterium]|nr:glycosyltransferase [Chloroflexota bacterium]